MAQSWQCMPMAKSSEFFDRLVERLDRLDPTSVQGYMLKLLRERGLLTTIFQSIHEGVVIIDRELHISFANNAAEQLLGLPAEVRERETVRIDRHLRDVDWTRLMSQDPSEWERVARQEIEVFYPTHRYLQFYVLPYKSDDDAHSGELGMAILILRDVTELRQKTEDTIETERLDAITMLAAGVAHEIGNPLNSLTIHLKLLERQLAGGRPDVEESVELLQVAQAEVKRLDGIIGQFLRAIRPTPPVMQSLNLAKVIGETVAFMKQEFEDRGVMVECSWDDVVPPIMGDPDQLNQCVYNIMRNALQAMPDGGDLQVELVATDQSLSVLFRDTGQGINAEQMSRIFNPYYTTKSTGTGLGLVIVERIVREHGGDLSVESDVGHGTLIRLSFPLQDRRTRLLDSPGDPIRHTPDPTRD